MRGVRRHDRERAEARRVLGQLALQSRHRNARAELAQHSLGRAYVSNCVRRDGPAHWTSANYLMDWTKEILLLEPDVQPEDLGDEALPQARKLELAQWEVVMLRLQFLADVAHLAPSDDPIATLRSLPERAARATKEVALRPLMKWIGSHGWRVVEAAFPKSRFHAIRDAKRPPTSTQGTSAAAEKGPTWKRPRATRPSRK